MFSGLVPPSFSELGNRGPAIRYWSESLFLEAGCRLEGFWKRLVPAKLQAICNHSSRLLPFYFNSLGFGLSISGAEALINKIHIVPAA